MSFEVFTLNVAMPRVTGRGQRALSKSKKEKKDLVILLARKNQ